MDCNIVDGYIAYVYFRDETPVWLNVNCTRRMSSYIGFSFSYSVSTSFSGAHVFMSRKEILELLDFNGLRIMGDWNIVSLGEVGSDGLRKKDSWWTTMRGKVLQRWL